jgi:hypothetical protein
MFLEIFVSTISLIGLGALGLFKIAPSLISSSVSEIQQQRNRVLLEEIKNDAQINLENLKADYTIKLEKVKQDYQKEIEVFKTGLLAVARYSEYQFELYNVLWASLYELKCKAEFLWEHASSRNLTDFANQLNNTKKKIEQNILLINDEHLQDLIGIIDTFERYKLGKRSLIDFRDREENIDNRNGHREIDRNDLQLFIDHNEQLKNNYICLIDELAVEFKNHLKEPMN